MAYGTQSDEESEAVPLTPEVDVRTDEASPSRGAVTEAGRGRLIAFVLFSCALVAMVTMPALFSSVYSASHTGESDTHPPTRVS